MGTYRHEMETARGRLEFRRSPGHIYVYLNGNRIGKIRNNPGDWKLIIEGENPLEDTWEDGYGNFLNYNGWGDKIDEKEEE